MSEGLSLPDEAEVLARIVVWGEADDAIRALVRWRSFLDTYAGDAADEGWEALFRTTALFRRIAIEVGDALGYEYPQHADDVVTAHLVAVSALLPR